MRPHSFAPRIAHRGLTLSLLALCFGLLQMAAPSALASGRPPAAPPDLEGRSAQNAPGYCFSYGGSTDYEEIVSVILTQLPGNILRVHVDVYIANPTGCAPGNPCPEYDASPEYVNVWIDWNGDHIWDPYERVMDEAGTGYLNISYQGFMEFETEVPIPPSAVNQTWLRANLGWGYDPNDPCETTWSWGNVVDQEVTLQQYRVTAIGAMGNITAIQGLTNPIWSAPFDADCVPELPTADYPLAGGFNTQGVSLSVQLEVCPGPASFHPHVRCNWSIPGFGGAAGQQGHTDFVGWSGTVPVTLPGAVGRGSVDLEFLISDDNGNLVAPPQLVTLDLRVGYEPALNAPKLVWLDKAVDLGEGGKTIDEIGISLVSAIWGHGGWQYIDDHSATLWAEMLEGTATGGNCYVMADMWVNLNKTLGVPGTWRGSTTGAHTFGFLTLTNHYTSFDPAQAGNAHPPGGGNDSWRFISHSFGRRGAAGSRYDPTFNNIFATDFSFIRYHQTENGVKSDAGQLYYQLESDYRAYIEAGGTGWGSYEYRHVPPPLAKVLAEQQEDRSTRDGFAVEIDLPFTFTAVDADLDGQAEALRVEGNLVLSGPAGSSTSLLCLGTLEHEGQFLTMRESFESMLPTMWSESEAEAGVYPFELLFSGEDIYIAGLDGPYDVEVTAMTADGGFDQESGESPAFGFEEFGEKPYRIGSIDDLGVDLDGDGLYNQILIQAEVMAVSAGPGWVSAALELPGLPDPVLESSVPRDLVVGANPVEIALDARVLQAAGIDGPYEIAIEVLDEGLTSSDRVIHLSEAYAAADFDPPAVMPTGTPVDYGQDTDGDGLFEALIVELPVTAEAAGEFQVSARLVHGTDQVANCAALAALGVGNGAIVLTFPGGQIEAAGLDGPWEVRDLHLSEAGGDPILYVPYAHTTQAYAHEDFLPLENETVVLTGDYASVGVDTNGDVRYDTLVFSLGAITQVTGNVVARAFLYTPSGELIEQSTGFTPAQANLPITIDLPVTGRRIYGKGENRPYEVRSLVVYQTGYPQYPAEEANPHSTLGYSWVSFQPAPLISGNVRVQGVGPQEGATVYLDPLDDFDYTNGLGDYRVIVNGDGGRTVTVNLQSIPGLPDDGWTILDNGEVVGTGLSYVVTPDSAEVKVVDYVHGFAEAEFVRGDVDDNGEVNISDPIYSLAYQFAGGPQPSCLAAADDDGSGLIDLSDPIYSLQFQFAGGPPPQSPYPECGFIPPGGNILPCAEFVSCDAPALLASRKGTADRFGRIFVERVLGASGGEASFDVVLESSRPVYGLEATFRWTGEGSDRVTFTKSAAGEGLDFLSARFDAASGQVRLGAVSDFRLREALPPGRVILGSLHRSVAGDGEPGVVAVVGGLLVADDLSSLPMIDSPEGADLDQRADPSGIDAKLDGTPTGLALGKPSPNPSHGTVSIAYGLPQVGSVLLAVYDVAGREVTRLVDEAAKAAGWHQVTWDGRTAAGTRAAEGVYFVRLLGAGTTVSTRMILLE